MSGHAPPFWDGCESFMLVMLANSQCPGGIAVDGVSFRSYRTNEASDEFFTIENRPDGPGNAGGYCLCGTQPRQL